MRNKLKKTSKTLLGVGLAAGLMSSCGSTGLGAEIKDCTPEVASTTPITDQEMGALLNFVETLDFKEVQDPTHDQGYFTNYDRVDKPGEIACRGEEGLVLTFGGLALQAAYEELNG